ncbi:MAG: ABC transporter permease [Planctomycetia bacterium]|nr:ABC transporter permease [Planctomycetia bacterium]
MALGRFTMREIRSRPGRAILTLLSVVIGVATVVSVNLAAQTTRRAYKDMFATMAGRASLEVMSEAGAGFDQDVLEKIEHVHGVVAAVPVIRRLAVMFVDLPKNAKGAVAKEGKGADNPPDDAAADDDEAKNRQKVQVNVLGIDPNRDKAVRDYRLKEGQWFDEKNKLLVDANFAENLHLKVGDEVRLLTPSRMKPYKFLITGLISPRSGSSVGQGVIYMSLEVAQKRFDCKGQIDSIQVVTQDDEELKSVEAAMARILPPGLVIRSPASKTQQADETLLSTEQGLNLATYFSWLLALLIVFNTFQMNVVERRRQLAILRAIGATRGQVMRVVCREGITMGIIGTALGILAGIGGAQLISRAMAQVLQTGLPQMEFSWRPLILAAIAGPVVSLLGAVLPAWRAGRLSPLEGMGAILPAEMESPPWTMASLGVAVNLFGGAVLMACIRGRLPANLAVLAALGMLIGLVLMIPVALKPLAHVVTSVLSPLLRVEGRLAEGQIVRRRGRTTLTVGVLFLAIAFGIGMANTIVDNVNDVKKWSQATIRGDYFVRAMMPRMDDGLAADLPAELGEEIKAIPSVAGVQTVGFANSKVGDQAVVIVVGEFIGPGRREFDLVKGDRNKVRAELQAGNVIIGSVLAQRTGLTLGSSIPLKIKGATEPTTVKVVGVTNEYMAGGLTMYMEKDVAQKMLGIVCVNAYILNAAPGRVDELGVALQSLCEKHGLILQSQKELLGVIDAKMAGLVGCLWFLLVLVFVVAAFGLINTLTMNVIEQTRELGLLRIVAMTRSQVRKMIMAQATLLASLGLVPGVLAGLAVAWLMNLSMQPVLGHVIGFHAHPLVIAGCFGVAFFIVLFAAWFPAERATRLKIAEALQYQ